MGGGLLHFLNLNHDVRRRKKKPNKLKRYTDGIESPKNTMKFLPETSSSSCQEKNPFDGNTLMKTLIAEEMTHKSYPNIHSAPSVIARLMGIDSLPSKPKPDAPFPTKSNQPFSCSRRKPRSREHPQEEILQKFKREFEAWQAYKTLEEQEKSPHQVQKNEQVINFKPLTNATTNQITLHREQCQLSSSESIISESSASPTRIVLLKPNCENTTNDTDENWIEGLSSFGRTTAHTQMNMEDFLEKVTEKLRMEVQGSPSRKSSYMYDPETVIGPREIAQNIARQVRESFDSNGDIERTSLIRSESSRIYSSESFDFYHRDAQYHETEKLINGLRNELGRNENSNEVGSRSSASTSVEDDQESYNIAYSSQRSLERSLSAPVSGMRFLENRRLDHDRRKHEEVRSDKKSMKDGFDFKGRVSNLKHNLNINIKGNFFGKKVHASERNIKLDEAVVCETKSSSVLEVLRIIPNERLENSTEVPPSPVSVSSTCLDELSKASDPSPVSPLDTPFIEEQQSSQNSDENLAQILDENSLCDIIPVTHDANLNEDECTNADYDQEEAYVKDILIISGLYEWEESGSCALLRLETLALPLAWWVFEEVEEDFSNKYYKENGSYDSEESFADRRILFGLVNETLPNVLKRFVNGIGLCRNSLTTTISQGNNLFEDVWNEIQSLTHVMEEEEELEYYLESLAAYDVGKAPWPLMMGGETCTVGSEVEVLILYQLVEDLVLGLYYD